VQKLRARLNRSRRIQFDMAISTQARAALYVSAVSITLARVLRRKRVGGPHRGLVHDTLHAADLTRARIFKCAYHLSRASNQVGPIDLQRRRCNFLIRVVLRLRALHLTEKQEPHGGNLLPQQRAIRLHAVNDGE
jgi:hypothetical protein